MVWWRDYYRFLKDEWFDSHPAIARVIEDMDAEDIYRYSEKDFVRNVRNVGEKSARVIVSLRDEYAQRIEKKYPDTFCECGMVKKDWWKYCPQCGASVIGDKDA